MGPNGDTPPERVETKHRLDDLRPKNKQRGMLLDAAEVLSRRASEILLSGEWVGVDRIRMSDELRWDDPRLDVCFESGLVDDLPGPTVWVTIPYSEIAAYRWVEPVEDVENGDDSPAS